MNNRSTKAIRVRAADPAIMKAIDEERASILRSAPVYRLNLFRILALVSRARALRKRETWSREQLERHQDRELARLRQFAYDHSPFYQRFHKGFEHRPLRELPILTKKELMRSWDDIVTDRSLRLHDIQRFSSASEVSKRTRTAITHSRPAARPVSMA